MLKSEHPEPDIEWFCERIQEAPLTRPVTNEKKFVMFMMIYILPRTLQTVFALSDRAVGLFQSKFKTVVDAAFQQFARPFVNRLDIHLNRFATARFELDGLLADCQKAFQDIRSSVGFPAAIKPFILKNIVALVDARASNKLLANPTRFSLGNSMVWSSFLTAWETAIGDSFTLTSQIAQALQMAPVICADPTVSDEICPALSKQLILFLLTSFVPDEVLPTDIDTSGFVTQFRLDSTKPAETVQPIFVGDYMDFVGGIRIADWNACGLQPDLLYRFPYLTEYQNTR
jgi:hypothetical protein